MPRDRSARPADPDPAPAGTSAATPIARLRASAGIVADGVSTALGAAIDSIRELPGRRVRRVRRRGRQPLPSLPDLYPDAWRASAVEVGLRTIDPEDIRGTAVGGGDQRGGDFLPLRPFRGANWRARWERLRRAQDELRDLPPIDVVKYDGTYWVIDGHNRVALALYTGQLALDASVVELVPPGGQRTEPIGSLAAEVAASRPVRTRVDTPERAGDDGADGEPGA